MPKNNKISGRVFAEIAETARKKGAYDEFLSIDESLNLPVSDLLSKLKAEYKSQTSNIAANIRLLAELEEIITQIRAKEVIDSELRLSLSRNYIYARSSFYRSNTKINDIRVLIGKTEDYGDDINGLMESQTFRFICKEKLIEAMDKEIEKNINQLNFVYNEEKNV